MSKIILALVTLLSVSAFAIAPMPIVGPQPTIPPETRVDGVWTPGQPMPVPPWEERLPK